MHTATSHLHFVFSVNCTRSMLWAAKSHEVQKAFIIRTPETRNTQLPIPVAARSTAWVCGRSLFGIAGSNPAGGMDVCLLWVLPGSGRWVGLITRPEESYRLWCVWVWSWILDNDALAHWGLLRHGKNNTKLGAEWPNLAILGELGTYRN